MGRRSLAAKAERRRKIAHVALGMSVLALAFASVRAAFMVLRSEANLLLAITYVLSWTLLAAIVGALLGRIHKHWPLTTRLPRVLASATCMIAVSTLFAELGTLAGTPWSNAIGQAVGFVLGALLIYVVYRISKARKRRRPRAKSKTDVPVEAPKAESPVDVAKPTPAT